MACFNGCFPMWGASSNDDTGFCNQDRAQSVSNDHLTQIPSFNGLLAHILHSRFVLPFKKGPAWIALAMTHACTAYGLRTCKHLMAMGTYASYSSRSTFLLLKLLRVVPTNNAMAPPAGSVARSATSCMIKSSWVTRTQNLLLWIHIRIWWQSYRVRSCGRRHTIRLLYTCVQAHRLFQLRRGSPPHSFYMDVVLSSGRNNLGTCMRPGPTDA